MSFSKVVSDRIRAGKNLLLGVGLVTPQLGTLNPDADVLRKLNELPAQYAALLIPLSANALENMELLAEFGALPIANTALVAELNALRVPDAELLRDPNQVVDATELSSFRQSDIVIATIVRMQYFGEHQELFETRVRFTVSRMELMLLRSLLPTFAQQFDQASFSQVIELEISSQTLHLLLKLIRGENPYLFDYTRWALEKIRLEAKALNCFFLVKKIQDFEKRFES